MKDIILYISGYARLTLLPERHSEIIKLHPDLNCDN